MTDVGERPMDWERLERLFTELVALPPADRAARLEQLQSGESALAEELASLVACAPLADRFFQALPRAVAAAAGELVRSDSDSSVSGDAPGFAADDHPGAVVGRYRIGEQLARGGMGVVYRASDTHLHRAVALKFLPPHLWVDHAARERLLIEARAAAALDHPNICTVYEVGETPAGALFLAMPHYEGETLRERLKRGALETDAAVAVATQAARALGAAHARGIVHRDVKPANLMLTANGTVKLLDFGLARLPDVTVTPSGLTPGTIAYMSPERVHGEPADARADLWAMGVVLYEMLTGRRPFDGESEAAVLHAILRHDPRPPSRLRAGVPPAVDDVVARLLRRDREERYRDAAELLADLERAGRPERARPHHALRRAATWVRIHRRARRRVASLAGTALVVAGLGAAEWLTRRVPPPARQTRAAGTGEARPAVSSLAVLPFKNYSGDTAQEYFADGMTDELTSTLTRIEALRVIAHQSVRQFKNSDRPVAEIARLLGVTHVVDGSVLHDGARVRITVNLIDAGRNATIWSEPFERERRDVLALQREVALAITRNVAVTLTPQDSARLSDTPPIDPDAFDLYVKGTQARYTSDPGAADHGVAADYFRRAIAKDSGYAPAYAGLAAVHASSNDEARARQLAEKARALDPGLAETYVVLGLIRQFYDRDWAGSEAAFREAIRLQPGFAEAHHELSMLLARRQRFDEALAAAQRTLYLAPMSARFHHGLGEVYNMSGRYDDAARAAAAARAQDSSWSATDLLSGIAYGRLGRYDASVAALERFRERLGEGACVGDLGFVYALSGRRERALELLEVCKAQSSTPDPGWAAYGVATIYAGLGDREQTLRWLEHAVATRPESGIYLAVDPAFRSLHAEPRFRAVLERMRLDE